MNGDNGYIAMQVSGLEVLPGAGLTDSGQLKDCRDQWLIFWHLMMASSEVSVIYPAARMGEKKRLQVGHQDVLKITIKALPPRVKTSKNRTFKTTFYHLFDSGEG
ncbi:hypothetical protein [Halomonas sp. CSM-2]|uniref:hypothetical protein n=1 Tax=Halomonas sp. CSM-2 TaxID=1975722 RepID=UPI00111C3578|nr:hypothetical protein [Halomonas sp. CSM-2]